MVSITLLRAIANATLSENLHNANLKVSFLHFNGRRCDEISFDNPQRLFIFTLVHLPPANP